MKTLFVYIMTNHLRTTVYIGVTNDLARRVWQHQHGEIEGFTKDYRLTLLVYYEVFPEPRAAIAREKQLKGWRRTKKDALVNSMNPEWRDLSGELFQAPANRRGPSIVMHPSQPGHPERSSRRAKVGGNGVEGPLGNSRGPSTALRPPIRLRSAQDDPHGKVLPMPMTTPDIQSPREDSGESAIESKRSRQP